jgi:hypothetical protein
VKSFGHHLSYGPPYAVVAVVIDLQTVAPDYEAQMMNYLFSEGIWLSCLREYKKNKHFIIGISL